MSGITFLIWYVSWFSAEKKVPVTTAPTELISQNPSKNLGLLCVRNIGLGTLQYFLTLPPNSSSSLQLTAVERLAWPLRSKWSKASQSPLKAKFTKLYNKTGFTEARSYILRLLKKYLFLFILFVWLSWVSVVAHGLFGLHCGLGDINCDMWVLISCPGIEPRPPALGEWS